MIAVLVSSLYIVSGLLFEAAEQIQDINITSVDRYIRKLCVL